MAKNSFVAEVALEQQWQAKFSASLLKFNINESTIRFKVKLPGVPEQP